MTSQLMKMVVQIVTAHLTNADGKTSAAAIPDLIETIYHKMAALEAELFQKYGVATARDGSDTPPSAHLIAAASSSDPSMDVAGVDGDDDDLAHPGVVNFNASKWLASIDQPTITCRREASAANEYLNRGWVGVYKDHIICLIDGKRTRVLTRRLAAQYKNDPRYATIDAYRQTFNLPSDYPTGAPDFKELISTKIKASHEKRRSGDRGRPKEIQNRIDAALAKSGLTLSRQMYPDTRPGFFPDTIVCLECGKAVPNISDHLENLHKTSLPLYRIRYKLSSRYPEKPDESFTPAEVRSIAEEHIAAGKKDPQDQVSADAWPGVFDKFIVCLLDGAQPVDLEGYIQKKFGLTMADYRARYVLPDDYPGSAPGSGGLTAKES